MRILIANDDGIYAAGIKAIAAEFSKKHQVMVVAPDHERSGASHPLAIKPSNSSAATLAGTEKSLDVRLHIDTAIEGMPINAPSFAADTVPE